MLIRRDVSCEGTVGSELLEAPETQLARKVFENGRSLLKKFTLAGKDINSADMICGGEVEVYIDLILSTFPENISLYRSLAEMQNSDQNALLVSKIITGEDSTNCVKQCLLLEDKMIGLQLSAEERERFSQFKYSRYPLLEMLEGINCLIEPLRPSATVYIFGAGHVSQKIAQLTNFVAFRTIIVDDRDEYAAKHRFPWADEIIVVKNFENCFQNLPVDRNSYLIIVARGRKYDYVTLAQALKTDACYIGMIGSRKKRDAIYNELRQRGVSDEQLARVYSPIGLPIKAKTPEEIAVSIVSELIKARAEQDNPW